MGTENQSGHDDPEANMYGVGAIQAPLKEEYLQVSEKISEQTEDEALTASDGHDDELHLIPMAMQGASFVETIAAVEAGDTLSQSLASIPDRMAFKIGTAAELIGVKPYVLRFWETEFDQLKPKKSRKGQRVYSRRDVETAMMIKKLLYEDRFSIEGARTRLKELRSRVKEDRQVVAEVEKVKAEATHQLEEVRSVALTELRAIVNELGRFRTSLN